MTRVERAKVEKPVDESGHAASAGELGEILMHVSSMTSHLDLEGDAALAEAQQKKVAVSIIGAFIGFALVAASYIAEWTFENPGDLPKLSALVGALLLGAPIVGRAISDLFKGVRHMTELVALAIVACMAISKYQEAGIVSFLMLLAELIQSRTALGARQAIEGLIRMTPNDAHVIGKDGKLTDVDAAAVKAGDRLRILPGETVPADGEIVNGRTTMNEASITGESLPVDKGPGEIVFAGAINLTGSMDVRVTRVGDDTTLGQVREMILDAEKTKIPIMRIIDQYIQWYTPVVLMIAFSIYFFTNDMQAAITALLVTCPCAFILATPTAMVAALSCAARIGILIKDVSQLEIASRLNAIVFDKTGTLTTGQLAVTRLSPAEGVDPAHMLTLAAAVESHSNHPVAQAVVRVAKEAKLELPEATDVREEPGMGVRATVNGVTLRIGRDTWLKEEGVSVDHLNMDAAETEGYSVLFLSENEKAIGWIGLEDKARSEALRATQELKKLGVKRLVMFTGDRWSVARRVAGELGCTEVEAECLPGRKLELVQKMKDSGLRVAVVGDGVNDAPALAAGDIGIAMGAAGSDVAIHSASVALMSSDLERLPFLVRLSRRARSIVNQNLLFALLFIIGTLSAAASGKLEPITAASLHIFGSFVVIFNSARLVRFGEHIATFEGKNK